MRISLPQPLSKVDPWVRTGDEKQSIHLFSNREVWMIKKTIPTVNHGRIAVIVNQNLPAIFSTLVKFVNHFDVKIVEHARRVHEKIIWMKYN